MEVAGRVLRSADPVLTRGRPLSWRKKRVEALHEPPGEGSKHAGKAAQSNVGKVLLPAGADRNLHRPTVRGYHRGRGRVEDWRMRP